MNLKEYSKAISEIIKFCDYMYILLKNHDYDYNYYWSEIEEKDYGEEELTAIYLSNFCKPDRELVKFFYALFQHFRKSL